MEGKYCLGIAGKMFLIYLQRLPMLRIKKWEKKYEMEEPKDEIEAEEMCEKRESRIIRISSSAYIWR